MMLRFTCWVSISRSRGAVLRVLPVSAAGSRVLGGLQQGSLKLGTLPSILLPFVCCSHLSLLCLPFVFKVLSTCCSFVTCVSILFNFCSICLASSAICFPLGSYLCTAHKFLSVSHLPPTCLPVLFHFSPTGFPFVSRLYPVVFHQDGGQRCFEQSQKTC